MAGEVPKVELSDLSQYRVAIISASWHEQICSSLIAGAERALLAANIKPEPVIFVPSSNKDEFTNVFKIVLERNQKSNNEFYMSLIYV